MSTIAAYSVCVVIALLMAFGVEQIITWNTILTEAVSRFVFAFTFPLIFILLLTITQTVFKRTANGTELLNQDCHPSFTSKVIGG